MTDRDAVAAIIRQIYESSYIPEGHKDKYVEHIQKNGFTDKMLDELEKIFAAEAGGLTTDIDSQEAILKALDQIIAEDAADSDQEQAAMLFSLHQKMGEDVNDAQSEMQEVEKDFEVAFEELGKESETSEIEKIRAKLLKK